MPRTPDGGPGRGQPARDRELPRHLIADEDRVVEGRHEIRPIAERPGLAGWRTGIEMLDPVGELEAEREHRASCPRHRWAAGGGRLLVERRAERRQRIAAPLAPLAAPRVVASVVASVIECQALIDDPVADRREDAMRIPGEEAEDARAACAPRPRRATRDGARCPRPGSRARDQGAGDRTHDEAQVGMARRS